VEAGDIMMVGDHFYIGESARTNAEGARQMIAILEKHGLSGSVVRLEKLLAAGEFDRHAFAVEDPRPALDDIDPVFLQQRG
ncbi:hypothetical protein ACV34F_30845, partial [Pseudomonas aeruginosa]